MGLTTWKSNIVRKGDVITAKNYLKHDEIDTLNSLVVIFLESAELRAKNRQDLTMNFWRENVDKMLEFQGEKLLQGACRISNAEMEEQIKKIYESFDERRKAINAAEADVADLEELKQLEEKIKKDK